MNHDRPPSIPLLEDTASAFMRRLDAYFVMVFLAAALLTELLLLVLLVTDSPLYFLDVTGGGYASPVYR